MAENGGHHAAGMAENGGDHAPAVAEHADNGGAHAPAVAVTAANGVLENGGGHASADDLKAAKGVVDNVGSPDPTSVVGTANGGNADPDHAAAAANGAMGNAGAAVPDLNLFTEDILYEFFLRMPTAMVARGRAVCRMWRGLSSTEAFRRNHHRHRSRHPMPLFFYRPEYEAAVHPDDHHVNLYIRAVDIHRRESFPVCHFGHPVINPPMVRIEGSCDGVLLLSYRAKLFAFNPSTRIQARLPSVHRVGDIIGFYARGICGGSKEYRVIFHDGPHDDWGCTYHILRIYRLGRQARCEVRYIGRPTNEEAIDLVLAGGICPSFEMPPIMVRERLHWRPQLYQNNSYLLVFDTADELFTWIPPPRVLEGSRWMQVEGEQLLEINGRLAMIIVTPTIVGVWVLQDYIGQVWTYEYQIQLPVAAIQANHGYVVTDGYEERELAAAVFAVSEDRNLLIQCPNALLQCDANGTLQQTYQLPANCPILTGYMLAGY